MIKSVFKWIATDGLLHFLCCYCGMVAFFPIIGWWNFAVVVSLALLKEGVDYHIEKDNDIKAVAHDLIMDAVGIMSAFATLLMLLNL